MDRSENGFEVLARAGYWAKGIVYILLGGLALSSVFAGGSGEDSPQGALSQLLGAPMGRVVLAAIALGLVGYVLWRLAQAVLDADRNGTDAKGLVTRGGQLASAIANGALALTAGGLAINGGGGSGSGSESLVAMVMSQPFGQWIVGIGGVIFAGSGITQVWRGAVRDYEDRLAIPARLKGVLDPLCQYGLIARGLLFVVIGGLIVFAAITVSPEDAGGFRDALDWLRAQPYGAVLYALMAAGLAAYGGYAIVQALYRRMDPPDAQDVKRMMPGAA